MSGLPGRTWASMKRKSYDFQKAGTIWRSKCHVYVDSGSAGTALLPHRILTKLARLFYNNFRPSWAEVIEIIIPNLGIFFGSNFPTTCREVGR